MEWKQNENTDQNRRSLQIPQTRSTEVFRWKRPQDGWYKCNTDGSFINTQIPSSAGWVIRDSNGVYKKAIQAIGRRTHNALESELQAILMALQHCWSLGITHVILESDCQKTVNIINNKRLHFEYYNWTREIRAWMANQVADKLAKDRMEDLSFIFHAYVPLRFSNLLHVDYIQSS